MTLVITLAQAREHGACSDGVERALASLGCDWPEDRPVEIERILDWSFDDAIWALDATGQRRLLRMFAADCAERVLPIFEAERPDDLRPRTAIRVARLYAMGLASERERTAAWVAARAAARAAAGDAAWAAAWVAARAAAGDAARAAAWVAARAAAGYATDEWQTARLREYLRGAR